MRTEMSDSEKNKINQSIDNAIKSLKKIDTRIDKFINQKNEENLLVVEETNDSRERNSRQNRVN